MKDVLQDILSKERISEYLEARGVDVQVSGSRMRCVCPLPGHDDTHPSFYIGQFADGADYFKCFGCLPGYQRILTPFGTKEAQDVKVGDVLIDAYGNETTVTDVRRHENKHPLIRIKTMVDNVGFVATQDHDMLWAPHPVTNVSVRNGKCRANKLYEVDLRHMDYNMWVPVAIPKIYGHKPIITLRPSMHSTGTTEVEIDRRLAWVIGYYAAEGSVSGNRLISFDAHEKEAEYVLDKISKLKFELKFGDVNIGSRAVLQRPRRNSKGRTITLCYSGLARWLKKNCGHSREDKKMPLAIKNAPLDIQASFIQGLMYGDSSADDKKLVCTSKFLVEEVFRVALACGGIPSFSTGISVEGKRDAYGVVLKCNSYEDIVRIANGGIFKPRAHNHVCHAEINGNWVLLVKIKSMKHAKATRYVYDITTSGTHTYSCLSIAVHNCQKSGNFISLLKLLETKSSKQVIHELCQKHGVKPGAYVPGVKSEPLPHEIMAAFCEEDALASDITTLARSYLRIRDGCEDAVNKVSRLYRKLDELNAKGDMMGMSRLMGDLKALLAREGKARADREDET